MLVGVGQQSRPSVSTTLRVPERVHAHQPFGQHAGVGLAQRAPLAVTPMPVEQVAEDDLAVGRAHRLEQRIGGELGPSVQAAAVREQPLPPAPGAGERLGVGVAQRAPERGADVEDEDRRLPVLARRTSSACGAGVGGRRLRSTVTDGSPAGSSRGPTRPGGRAPGWRQRRSKAGESAPSNDMARRFGTAGSYVTALSARSAPGVPISSRPLDGQSSEVQQATRGSRRRGRPQRPRRRPSMVTTRSAPTRPRLLRIARQTRIGAAVRESRRAAGSRCASRGAPRPAPADRAAASPGCSPGLGMYAR